MRYYVIINGVNSLTIEGLAIKTLPPISKPAMRNLREEIDGRDGDITTELGYGAYDKVLEIGLYGDYDIDKIISFFNSKGTITFSDEPDKYYNFEIVDRIDYTKLVKFRTATINIHCQPFKYPLNETPIEEAYEYIEAEGTNITLNNTAEANLQIDLKGNTSQNGTPTPTSPIPINVVSGDNTINVCGKNIFNSELEQNAWSNSNGTSTVYSTKYVRSKDFNNIRPNITYTISFNNSAGDGQKGNILFYDKSKNFINQVGIATHITFTTPSNAYFVRFNFQSSSDITINDITNIQLEKGNQATTYEPYIGKSYPIYLRGEDIFNSTWESGSIGGSGSNLSDSKSIRTTRNSISANTTYIANVDTTTSINEFWVYYYNNDTFISRTGLGSGNQHEFTTPSGVNYVRLRLTATSDINTSIVENQIIYDKNTRLELCKINTYQDYIYKDNGSWYLHKEIGKVVLDGTTNVEVIGTAISGNYRFSVGGPANMKKNSTTLTTPAGLVISDKFIEVANEDSYQHSINGILVRANNSNNFIISCIETKNYIATQFISWLQNNPVLVYYVLATPTDTLIEDTTLIEQLEEIKNANSYEGTTNIGQVNNDLPFILDTKALKKDSDKVIINNEGNIYSKPTLDLEGTGIVDIYLNDTQMFEVDLSETNEIVIDTQAMEAYNPTDNTLANRQVTGDYSKFKLEVGDNDLKFSGDLTKATITNYVRWL